MHIIFNHTGTHIKRGLLKIRLDFYPDVGDKSYESQRVYVVDESSLEYIAGYKGALDKDDNPVDFEDYRRWLDGLPHVWRVTPCLSHFVIVPSTITKAQLENYINTNFRSDIVVTIDDMMTQVNSMHLISPFMRDKTVMQRELVTLPNTSQLISAVNERLSGLYVGESGDGEIIAIEPQSIDAGPGATNRGTSFYGNRMYIALDNPVDADGILDTFECWYNTNASGVKCGTFSGSDTSWDDRDYEAIGSVTAGAKRTFTGLSIDAIVGDLLGAYSASGYIESDSSGYAGYYYKTGDYFGTGANTYYLAADSTISIYAAGASGAVAKTSSDTGSGVDAQSAFLAACVKSDSGVGSDALGARALSLIESTLGVDASTLLALLASSDTASGVDVVTSLLSEYLKQVNDAGVGVDAALSRFIALVESASGVDSLTLLLAVIVSADVTSGVDALQALSALLSKSDSGVASDVKTSLNAILNANDTATALDIASSILASLAVSDVITSVESSIITTVVVAAILLHLRARATTLHLYTRPSVLTLRSRDLTLTLHDTREIT